MAIRTPPNRGGIRLQAAQVRQTDRQLVVDGIALSSTRPTDARLRRITIEAHDPNGRVIAAGRSRTAGLSSKEMTRGLMIPGYEGSEVWIDLDESIPLKLRVDASEVPDEVDLRYMVETYDRLYRIASGTEIERYTTADVNSLELDGPNAVLAARRGVVRLRPRKDVCLGNQTFKSYADAVASLALPRMRFKPPAFESPDDAGRSGMTSLKTAP